MTKLFNSEEDNFLRNNVQGRLVTELTEMFNKKFNRNVTIKQIREYKKTNRLKSGVKTCFIKGKRPSNYKTVGSEFVNKDGYTYIKIANPNTWVHKQQYIYEQKYGKIPENHSVVFADGNKNNFNLDNLILMRNKDKLVMKNKHLIFNDKDLTKTGLLIAQLINMSAERGKINGNNK